jgi:murein tripeptide amidase MpaA
MRRRREEPRSAGVRNRDGRDRRRFRDGRARRRSDPANFLAGYRGHPELDRRTGEKFYDFARRLAEATPDFQTDLGYEKSAPGQANLSMSTNQLAERFGAVSMTLEMPFKDHDANADAEFAWSPGALQGWPIRAWRRWQG